MKKGVFVAFILLCNVAQASTLDCLNLYVGRIEVVKGVGLNAVVFINSVVNSSGSYWTNFNGWTEFDKANALALLSAAKMNEHRVNVITEASGGCSIQSGPQTIKHLYLANNK